MPSMRPDRIAIVDDDTAARDALQFLLSVLGARPQSFASPIEFLKADIKTFACLILDQHMPSMTGLELAQRIRSASNTIPILLISGYLTQDVVDRASRAGVDLVSEKPPELAVLSAFVDDAIHR